MNILKPALGVTQMSDGDLLARLNAVHDGMLNNPAFPTPPIDMPGFKAAIDAYTAAVSAALEGGKPAKVARDKRRRDAVIMLRLLGHYVEGASKGDLNTFVSSGFVPAPARKAVPTQPVSVPSILKVEHGNAGELVVSIHPVPRARSYELRYAAGGTTNWITVVVASTKPPTTISNLTRGTDYAFQVRAFNKLGFSDWSGTANQMAT